MATSISGWCKEFFDGLPPSAGPAREEAILGAVQAGRTAPIVWAEVQSERDGRRATIFVSADALRVGDAVSSIRVNATARTTQRIADLLDCVLPTARICDLIWEQAACQIPPSFQASDGRMADTARMLRHHESVEKKVAGRGGLIENVGKHWVLTNRLAGAVGRAANYGWYDAGAVRAAAAHRMWQPVGLAHNLDHVDYSQVVRLVRRACVVDGVERDLTEVMVDPELAPLVSCEGPMRVVRLPGV